MTQLCTPAPASAADPSRRLRIALVNQPWDYSLPPQQTSLSIWSYQVARVLADTCDMVVYGRKRADTPPVEARDGVTWCHIRDRWDSRITHWLERFGGRRPITAPLVASQWYGREYATRVARDIAARGCDLALVFNYSQFAPILKRHNPNLHVVLDMQCEWASQLDRTMIARRLECVDTVVGCSAYIADKVRQRYPHFPGECKALYNGVSPAQFAGAPATPADHPRVLFVGRVSPEKGLHVLIDAFARVVERLPDARLDILGAQAACPREILVDLSDEPRVQALGRFYDDRSYHDHLVAQIERLGLTEHVIFSGFQPHAESVKHFRQAWVLSNPSLSEAFGMSLAEGMAAGIPVVATRVGGMVEVVDDGVTGRVVPPDDPAALGDALVQLLGDAELRARMGQAGRQRAIDCFSWQRIAGDLAALAAQARTTRTEPRP